MLIIGCDFHTPYQPIAVAEDSTGELLLERRLDHESGEAEAFYRSLQKAVRVGIEATGPIHYCWQHCPGWRFRLASDCNDCASHAKSKLNC